MTNYSTPSCCIMLMALDPASAQVRRSGHALLLDLAVEAAQVAIRECAGQGWPVTATVADTSGLVRVQFKHDVSVVHTGDTAFRKASTVVIKGTVFGFNRSSEFVRLVAKNPGGAGG